MDFTNIDVYFSSDCNMNCKYCYIEKKHDDMAKYNARIIESICDGSFVSSIADTVSKEQSPDKVESIGLWGAEPTINTRCAAVFLQQVHDKFINCREVCFSTNALLGFDALKVWIDAVERIFSDRKFTLEIQFSIDGPAWINDDSRHPGATKNTADTILRIAEHYEALGIRLRMTNKATVDMSYIKQMVDDPSLIQDYFDYFHDLQDRCEKAICCDNITPELTYGPTLVDPGDFTVEDGRTYRDFIHILNTTDFKNELIITQPFAYFTRKNAVIGGKGNGAAFGSSTCGSGRCSFAMGCDGKVFTCHRLFSQSYRHEDNGATRGYTSLYDDNVSWQRLKYVAGLPHYDVIALRQYLDIMIYPMAKYGQIEKEYLTNKQMRNYLFAFISSIFCFMGQAEETGDPFYFSPTYLRLYGNGALQELLRYGLRHHLLRLE